MSITPESIWTDVQNIRERGPLVHNITNYVVMNSTANALLSLGASPVMAHAEEEVADMVKLAGALVINPGTLSAPWVRSMHLAANEARRLGTPVVLDPVGAGATTYRTETNVELIRAVPPSIIRGNASEIRAVAAAMMAAAPEEQISAKGVDSLHSSDSAVEAAIWLSEAIGGAVCVSGAVDYCVQGNQVVKIRNGHPLMPRVTGLGCTASALCGAFAAVNPSPLLASAHAMAVMGIAGELAAEKAAGPGTLQLHFLDALYTLSLDQIAGRLVTGG